MTKEEFIEWFKANVCFERYGSGDTSWRNMVDYADYRFDYVYINETDVDYSWEELYWGGSETRERTFTFEDFIENYKNDTIKN
jgi:hypothetical protein